MNQQNIEILMNGLSNNLGQKFYGVDKTVVLQLLFTQIARAVFLIGNIMSQERRGPQESTPQLDEKNPGGIFFPPGISENEITEILEEKGDGGTSVIQPPRTVTNEEMIIAQMERRRLEIRWEKQLDGRDLSKRRGREKSLDEHKEKLAKSQAKLGSDQGAVENELAQLSGPDPDASPSALTYVPPEDQQILAKFAKPEIDLPGVARITRELPDPLESHASLIGSATEDPEIARIFIEGQNRGNHNGSGPSKLPMFSLNPLHSSGAPEEDDYSPDSRP